VRQRCPKRRMSGDRVSQRVEDVVVDVSWGFYGWYAGL
jgi:hypothetical protein